jgi:hypothetical protein
MILHSDGRIEGTPAEIAELKKLMNAEVRQFEMHSVPTEEPTYREEVPGSIILMSKEEKQKVINDAANVYRCGKDQVDIQLNK